MQTHADGSTFALSQGQFGERLFLESDIHIHRRLQIGDRVLALLNNLVAKVEILCVVIERYSTCDAVTLINAIHSETADEMLGLWRYGQYHILPSWGIVKHLPLRQIVTCHLAVAIDVDIHIAITPSGLWFPWEYTLDG